MIATRPRELARLATRKRATRKASRGQPRYQPAKSQPAATLPATPLDELDRPVHLAWAPEIATPSCRWDYLPAPTIDAECYIDPALDALADEPHGEVRYTARDGRRLRLVKGHPAGHGQQRLF